jgi:hypothetical protein
LYVPQNGIITPNVMRVEDSLWMVIWVAVGGRGRRWGAVIGALMANFTYSILTSDMPKAWPFIQGGLFLGALAFPGGIADLWTRLEQGVIAGARIGRAAVVLAFVVGFLAVDKLEWLPHTLALTEFIGVQSRYWILIVGIGVLSIGAVVRSAIPLLTLTALFVTEAFGLMPASLAVVKYVIAGLVLGGHAVAESGWHMPAVGILRWPRHAE